jgi:hypothetical protein
MNPTILQITMHGEQAPVEQVLELQIVECSMPSGGASLAVRSFVVESEVNVNIAFISLGERTRLVCPFRRQLVFRRSIFVNW